MLDEATQVHPHSWWWIKGDACDITKGLGKSATHHWSGDIDLGDGELEKQYSSYQQRVDFTKGIGLPPRHDCLMIAADLKATREQLNEDITFVLSGILIVICL